MTSTGTSTGTVFGSFMKFSLGPWVSAIIAFFTTPLITWLILPTEVGKATMFSVAYSFLLAVVGMGTDQSFVRMYHEKPAESRSGLLLQALVLPLSIALVIAFFIALSHRWVSFLLFEKDGETAAVITLCCTLLCGVIERYSSLLLRMKNRGMEFSLVKLIGTIVNTAAIVGYAILWQKTFHAVIYAVFISSLFSSVVAVFLEKDFWYKVCSQRDLSDVRSIIVYGMPYVPAFFLDSLFQSLDKVILRKYVTFNELGVYSTAFKLVSALTLIQIGFSNFWAPLAYEKYQNDPDYKAFYIKIFKISYFVLFLAGLLLILFKDIIVYLFSADYRSAATISPPLILMPILYTVSEITVMGINLTKKTRSHLFVALAAVIACAIANICLVPAYGVKGAALSIAFSYTVFFYIRTYIARSLLHIQFDLSRFSLSLFFMYLCIAVNMVDISSTIQNVVVCVCIILLCAAHATVISTSYQFLRKSINPVFKMKTS